MITAMEVVIDLNRLPACIWLHTPVVPAAALPQYMLHQRPYLLCEWYLKCTYLQLCFSFTLYGLCPLLKLSLDFIGLFINVQTVVYCYCLLLASGNHGRFISKMSLLYLTNEMVNIPSPTHNDMHNLINTVHSFKAFFFVHCRTTPRRGVASSRIDWKSMNFPRYSIQVWALDGVTSAILHNALVFLHKGWIKASNTGNLLCTFMFSMCFAGFVFCFFCAEAKIYTGEVHLCLTVSPFFWA